MPIIDVTIVEDSYAVPQGLAQRLADAIGRVLSSKPSGTWVKVKLLPRALYAENEVEADGRPDPIFVSITQRALPSGEILRNQTRALTRAVATVCERPEENVHLIYEPKASGRVAFGGTLVE
jgi:phenylpyruvate tautomerase PptA (4-oxalocrotonate tautomerase family)